MSDSFNESIENIDNWRVPSGDLSDTVKTNQMVVTNWGSHQGGAILGGSGHSPAQLPDPDTPGKLFQSVFMVLDMIDELEDVWSRNNSLLSYDVQVKHAWFGMTHAADGICVRWNSPEVPGCFEGLGISFMNYSGIGPGFNDFIPDSIKPPGLADTPLLVLWEQHASGGVETRNWIAYKNLNPDNYVWNAIADSFGKMSSLFVRVTEGKGTDGNKINTLKIFYGDATNPATFPGRLGIVGNDIPYDLNRWIYPPSWSTGSPGIRWPDDTVDDWREENDYMTWVIWDAINPGASGYVLSSDSMSIVTGNFVTPDDVFSDRNEIALHAFGNLEYATLFDDFVVRTVQHGFGTVIQQ